VSTSKWIPCALVQAQTGPLKGSPERQQADPLARAARGFLILAFAVGAIGTQAAAPGHESGDHSRGYQPKSGLRLDASVTTTNPDLITPQPWMY
jgi:hypothetical protein